METIFLAYANSATEPLSTLRQEDDGVYSLLSRRSARQHFALHRDASVTLSKIAEYLIRFRDDLNLFVFSGHAGRDVLLLEDQAANAGGIADLLGQCPRLKLVMLNGCSTKGQVEQLLKLPNCPAVIATSAPVGDFTAAQFAISFFQAFSEQYASLGEAFAIGLAAAKAASQQPLTVESDRGLALRGEKPQPLWGLYTADGYESQLNWKLPQPASFNKAREPQPNEFLLKGLLQSLAAFDPEVRKAQKLAQQASVVPGMVDKSADRKQRNAVLLAWPFPISVHLQKLLAQKRASMEGHDFYDEFGLKRLRQLVHTYNTVIELPAFVLLAQLWDVLSERKPLSIDGLQRQIIKDYVSTPPEQRIRQVFFPLVKEVISIFQHNSIPLFLKELEELDISRDGALFNACMAMELKKERLARKYPYSDSEIIAECVEAEEKLGVALSSLAFLAGYSLVSVRNIDVLHNRQIRTPSYLHRLVRLVQHFSEDPSEEIALLQDFLDNASVLMMRKSEDDEDGEDEDSNIAARRLNLTPFVIDENAYVQKAEDHKLFYFLQYEPQREAYFFKHIYKPEDPPLLLAEQDHLTQLIHQFQVFWQLLSDQSVETL